MGSQPIRNLPSEPDPGGDEYDDTVADSFPASDPPPGVIKVGPRKRRPRPAPAPPVGPER